MTIAGIEVAFWSYSTFKTGWNIVDVNRHQINWSCRCLTYGLFTMCRAIMLAVVIVNPKCKGTVLRCICNHSELTNAIDKTIFHGGDGGDSVDPDCKPEQAYSTGGISTGYMMKCDFQLVCRSDLDFSKGSSSGTATYKNKDTEDSHDWDDEDNWGKHQFSMSFSFGLSLLATLASFAWFVGASNRAIHNEENKIAWKLYLQMASVHIISMFVANMAAYNVFDDATFPAASSMMILSCVVGIVLFNWRFSGDDCGDVCSCCIAMLPNKEEGEEYNPERDSQDYTNYKPSNTTPYAILEGGHRPTSEGYTTGTRQGYRS